MQFVIILFQVKYTLSTWEEIIRNYPKHISHLRQLQLIINYNKILEYLMKY